MDKSIPWELSQLKGQCNTPLIATFAACTGRLTRLGILTCWTDRTLEGLSTNAGYGERCEQDDRCSFLFGMVRTLVHKRILRQFPFLFGWPRLFVLLLDATERLATIQRLRQDKANFDMLDGLDDRWAETMWKRSTMHLKVVKQVLLLLEASNWEVTDRIRDILEMRGRRVLGSQITVGSTGAQGRSIAPRAMWRPRSGSGRP